MAFGQKQGPDQVTTTKPVLSPGQQSLLDSAQGGVSPTAPGQTGGQATAQDYWTNLVQQAGLAGRGLSGDSTAASAFAAPGMSALLPMFDRMRQTAQSQAGLATTSPFGIGARSGIQLAQANQGINEQQGQLTYQNIQEALNRMLQMQNFGMGASGALQQQGMQQQMLPMAWQQGRLGLLGPTGTEQRTPTQSDWLSTALGIGSIVAAPFTGGASLAMTPGLLNEGGSHPTGPTAEQNPGYANTTGWSSPYGPQTWGF